MRLANLFLAVILGALLFTPLEVTASEVGARFEKVVKERDSVVKVFDDAVQGGYFKPQGDADKVRAQLDLINTLLKEAQHDIHKHRRHHANAKLDAAESLIERVKEDQ